MTVLHVRFAYPIEDGNPFDAGTPVMQEFGTAADLERHLLAQHVVLTQHTCPTCSTRLSPVGATAGAQPTGYTGLLACLNHHCGDHQDIRFLPTEDGLRPVDRTEFRNARQAAYRRGLDYVTRIKGGR